MFIITRSMSDIIPTISVGDPFMQEDTVELNFSTSVDIARLELGLPITRETVTAITDSVETEGAFSTMTLQQRGLVDMDARTDKKHRLAARVLDGSPGSSRTTKGSPLTDGCNTAHPAAHAEAQRLSSVTMGQSIEADIEEKRAKRNTT